MVIGGVKVVVLVCCLEIVFDKTTQPYNGGANVLKMANKDKWFEP